MISEAHDFKAESDNLAAILADLEDAQFDKVTLFKAWTINDVIGHLHLWNHAADLTLADPDKFTSFITSAVQKLMAGISHRDIQTEWFGGKSGRVLYDEWCAAYPRLADRYQNADPEHRVKWAGPDMSVRSCIIARQMETWAHAQAVFDLLGLTRKNSDRLKNVAHIGVTTYSWSYKVNGLDPVLPKPYVRLTAPSGAVWEWNDPQKDNQVSGSAEEFCQIVTQTRNVGDTNLTTVGDAARKWMEIAQCFAGAAETPPAAGERFKTKD